MSVEMLFLCDPDSPLRCRWCRGRPGVAWLERASQHVCDGAFHLTLQAPHLLFLAHCFIHLAVTRDSVSGCVTRYRGYSDLFTTLMPAGSSEFWFPRGTKMEPNGKLLAGPSSASLCGLCRPVTDSRRERTAMTCSLAFSAHVRAHVSRLSPPALICSLFRLIS